MIDWRGLRWEMRIMLRERLLPIIFVTLAIAALMATLNGHALTRQWSMVGDRFAAAAAEANAKLAGSLVASTLPPVEAGAVRASYIRPVPPLLGLAAGRAMLDPIAVTVVPTDQIYRLFRDYQTDNPWTLAIGRFDWAFLLAVVVPLLIIALGYDVLARDRDLGIDRQLALGGGGQGRLLVTRILARATPLAVAIIVLMTVAFLVTKPNGAGGLRLLAVLALAAGGMLFWWGLIALVNLRQWSAVRSASILLGVWAALAFVIPSLVDAAAQAIAPPPSRIALTAEARTAEIAAQTKVNLLVDRYLALHPELPANPGAAARVSDGRFAVSLDIDRAVAPALDRFNAALARQQRVVGVLQFLSPVGAEQALMTEIAGTSYTTRALFQTAANRHYAEWRSAVATLQFSGRKLTPTDVQQLPRFDAAGPSTIPLVALAIFLVIAVVPAALSFGLTRNPSRR